MCLIFVLMCGPPALLPLRRKKKILYLETAIGQCIALFQNIVYSLQVINVFLENYTNNLTIRL